jgi:D-glycero-alpha-D-manno-heptose-7-phosphate kinase
MTTNFQDLIINEDQPIVDGIAAIERTAAQIALITDGSGTLVGILTNGDVRRSLVLGLQTSAPVRECMNREFKALRQGSSREDLLRLFALGYNAVPIIDEHRHPVGLDTPDLIPTANLLTVAARASAPLPICLSATEFGPYQSSTSDGIAVLDASLALYAHATVVRTETPEIRLHFEDASQQEQYNSLRELLDSPDKSLLCVVASVLRPTFGFSMLVRTDLPGYLGLGGETAIAMSVIAAFNELRAEPWSNYQMVRLAHGVERLSHNLPGERRDGYPFIFGGFNLLESGAMRRVVHSIRLDTDIVSELEANLMLCVLPSKPVQPGSSVEAAALEPSYELAMRMRRHLLRGELKDFGTCLHEVWTSHVSAGGYDNEDVSKVYDAARAHGALGGKLLGSGSLAAFIFFVDPRHRAAVSIRLADLGCALSSIRFDDQGVRSWRTKAA